MVHSPAAAVGADDAQTLDVVQGSDVVAVLLQVKLTPGRKTLSTKPLRIAGKPMFQTGKENTSASAASSRST